MTKKNKEPENEQDYNEELLVKNDNAMVKRTSGDLVLANNAPAELIKAAITGGADLDKLEKLLTLQERWERNEARKEYHKAMAEFKADPPKIEKDRTVSYKEVKYNHASLSNVTEKINSALSKRGLSVSWITNQTEGAISVTCKITHIKGHSEETTLTAGADVTGSKNSIQAIGSTITYLERYSLLALTGLATHDQDDDGQSSEAQFISEEEGNKILDLILGTGTDMAKFYNYLKIKELSQLPKKDYGKAILALENKMKEMGKCK